jgi:hypothetical protein
VFRKSVQRGREVDATNGAKVDARHQVRLATQLTLARSDPMYRVPAGISLVEAIPFGCDFEKQIQTNEITQEALTSNRIAARTRCPLSLVADQTTLRVVILQTPSVNRVEIAILWSFLANENSASDGRASPERSVRLDTWFARLCRFLTVFPRNWISFFRSDTHKPDQKPKSFPKKRDPMYSNCHSGQGGINVAIHTSMATLAHFCARG